MWCWNCSIVWRRMVGRKKTQFDQNGEKCPNWAITGQRLQIIAPRHQISTHDGHWPACLRKMTFSFVAMKTQHTHVWPWLWKMGQLVKHKRLLLWGWDQTQPSLVGLARIGRRWLAEPAVADDICSGAICNSLRWKVPPFYSSANPFKWPALLSDIHLCTVGGRGSNQRYKLLWRVGKWKLSSKEKQSQAAH